MMLSGESMCLLDSEGDSMPDPVEDLDSASLALCRNETDELDQLLGRWKLLRTVEGERQGVARDVGGRREKVIGRGKPDLTLRSVVNDAEVFSMRIPVLDRARIGNDERELCLPSARSE